MGREGKTLRAARIAILVLALAVVARLLWLADWDRTGALLRDLGPAVVLVLLPFLAGMSFDTAGWRAVLGKIGAAVPYVPLLRMRLASEALALSVPAGAVAAEAMKTILLSREHRVPATAGVASIAIKKIVYVIAHGLYLAVGFLCGREAIARMAAELGSGRGVAAAASFIYAAVALAMLGVGIALALASWRGGPVALLLRITARLPGARLRAWLARRAPEAQAIDGAARVFFGAGPRAIGPVLGLLFLQWLTDAAETFLILRLLGVEVDIFSVIAFDALSSFVRSVAFFVPAGVGVQELGQMLFINALGVPEAASVTAALVLVKRGKELAWTMAGYALLGRAWRTA